MRTRPRHPAFLALCVLASREDWCWNIHCGTCGHWHFRLGLVELARGKHPEDRDWVVKAANREVFDAFAEVGDPLLTKVEQAVLVRLYKYSIHLTPGPAGGDSYGGLLSP